MQPSILQPLCAMMLLTMLVWATMYFRRIGYMLANRIDPQRVASPELINTVLPETVNRPSNNLKNLFEMPVIFYAACLALQAIGAVDSTTLALAWAFVMLRAAHSAIQCSSNVVRLRFAAYLLSSLVLWAIVARLCYEVFIGR